MKFRLIISSDVASELSRTSPMPVWSPILWPADKPIPAMFIEVDLDLAETSKTDGGGGASTPESKQPAGEAT